MQFIIIPFLLLLMYALVIRPQQKRVRDQHAVVASLVVGDEVMCSAGILGRITELTAELATLEVAEGVQIRIARGAIARRVDAASETEPIDVTSTNDPARGED